MKTLLSVLFSCFAIGLFSQTIVLGSVKGPNINCWYKNCRVQIFIGDSIADGNVSVCQNDSLFALVVPPVDQIDLVVEYHCCGTFIFRNINITSNSINNIGDLVVDPTIRLEKCPLGVSDEVIPILYGKPSLKASKAAEKGEVYLGGCAVSDCDPTFHCTKHSISF